MNTIQNQYQAAVEEFGEDAYKRFEVETYDFVDGSDCEIDRWFTNPISNEEVEGTFNHEIRLAVKLKLTHDLIVHDIEVYGEQAYFMWETHGVHDYPVNIYRDFEFGDDLVYFEAYDNGFEDIMTRKTSSALPFDIERAKAGDVVECFYSRTKSWLSCTLSNKFGHINEGVEVCCDGELFIAQANNLCMKYPPKQRQGDRK